MHMYAEITHVDTCLPGYFNGSTHTVLAVPVDGTTTIETILDSLDEETAIDYGWEDTQYNAFDLALEALRRNHAAVLAKPFDASLEIRDACADDDSVYAYFTVQFFDE